MPTLTRTETDRLNDLSRKAFHGVSSKWMKLVDAGMPVESCEIYMNSLIESLARIKANTTQGSTTDEGRGD